VAPGAFHDRSVRLELSKSQVEADGVGGHGRQPNGDQLEPQLAGLRCTPMDRLVVDEYLRTTAAGYGTGATSARPNRSTCRRTTKARVVAHKLGTKDDLQAWITASCLSVVSAATGRSVG